MAADPAIADLVELLIRCVRLRASDAPYATRVNDARHISAMNGGFLHELTSRMGTEPPFKRYDRPEREADKSSPDVREDQAEGCPRGQARLSCR